MTREREIIVIGAGITGLSCAWELKKNHRDVEILEVQNRIGGQIHTEEVDGFIFESGPNTGVVKHPEVAELFEDMADRCSLETARDSSKRRLIWKGNQFHELPSGPVSAITTPLFTWKDKFRILGEPWRKKGTDPDETVGALAERRLGKSFVEYAVDPFLSGVYAGDPYRLPVRLALPKLYHLEQNYGSFIRGSFALAKIPKSERDKKATKKVFSSVGGFSNLVEALGDAIGHDRITTDAKNIVIVPCHEEGANWTVTFGNETIHCQHVVTTCGAYALPSLLPFVDPSQMAKISNLFYAPVVQIGVGIRHTEGLNYKAFGGLVPSKENQEMLGILFPSACFVNRAPQGGATFAYFIGGIRHPEYLLKSDLELKDLVNRSLHEVLKYPRDKQADVIRIYRHPRAIPQYFTDMDERLQVLQAIEEQYPTLHIIGNLRDGIGMGDRIKQGTDMGKALL